MLSLCKKCTTVTIVGKLMMNIIYQTITKSILTQALYNLKGTVQNIYIDLIALFIFHLSTMFNGFIEAPLNSYLLLTASTLLFSSDINYRINIV